jgi:fructose-1,6-bisphosphatase/inositol monophosphatase family enzyme
LHCAANTFTKQVTDDLIRAVRESARSEIIPRFRTLAPQDVSSKSAPDDLVTAADLAMEARLSAAISRIMPDARILGEEAAASTPEVMDRVAMPGLCVIIDPVDGTWNFASGLTTFGVILAITLNGETEFGLLYDPLMDDWIMARRGSGAWYCRPHAPAQKLSVSPATSISDMTGFLSLSLFPKARQKAIAKGFPAFRRVLSLRCACHEYRTLASGRVSFMLTGMLKPWDHAAGALIVTEAGGVARMLDGRAYVPTLQSGAMLAASDTETWSRLRDHFAPRVGL